MCFIIYKVDFPLYCKIFSINIWLQIPRAIKKFVARFNIMSYLFAHYILNINIHENTLNDDNNLMCYLQEKRFNGRLIRHGPIRGRSWRQWQRDGSRTTSERVAGRAGQPHCGKFMFLLTWFLRILRYFTTSNRAQPHTVANSI